MIEQLAKLPVFDHIPDFIYAQTPVPESLQEAEQICRVYKEQIQDLSIQLANHKQENSHWFNGDLTAWRQWRYKTRQALRIKKAQHFLVSMWLRENYIIPNQQRNAEKRRRSVEQPTSPSLTFQRSFESRQESPEKKMELMKTFTLGEFSQLRREVLFLRRSIGEISDQINLALNDKSFDSGALLRLADALNERDRPLQVIDQKLWGESGNE